MNVNETHLSREIHEQPLVLEQLLNQERPAVQRLVEAGQTTPGRLRAHRRPRHQR